MSDQIQKDSTKTIGTCTVITFGSDSTVSGTASETIG